MSVLPECITLSHECGAYGNQKRVLDPLELELWTVVSCRVDAGS